MDTQPQDRRIRMKTKLVKRGATAYIHISPLILEEIHAFPGDMFFVETQTDGSLKIEQERKED